MSSKFEQCKSTGYLEKVSAGEVCSLAVAKAIGIDNIANNDYYKREYGNIKTYNEQKDALENRTSYQLCTPSEKEPKAYPLCPLQAGAGIGFTEEYVNDIDSYACVTSECPTEFKQYVDKDGPSQLKCAKPKKSKTIPLGKQNDERWYDWFTIPEYHIGNGFNTSNNVNYRPCDKGSVPLYTTDPVDGLSVGFEASYNRMDRCVSKVDYFGGKYADGPSYCPIAWIVRAGATKKDYIDMYNDMLDKLDDTGTPAAGLDTLRKSIPSIVDKEIYQPIQKEGYKTIIGPLLTDEDENACSSIMRDTERVNATYNLCKMQQENPDGFRDRLRRDITEAARGDKKVTKESIDNKVNTRFERTRQACHTVFCDPDGPGMSQVESGSPICYPDVEKANKEQEIKAAEELEKEAQKPLPPITSDKDKEKAKRTATKGVLEMIKTLLMFIAIIFFYYKVWPFLKKLYETQIKPLFSRHAKTAQQLEAEEATRDLVDMYRPPKPSASSADTGTTSTETQGIVKATGKGQGNTTAPTKPMGPPKAKGIKRR